MSIAWVTGATAGIGRECCLVLAEQGWDIIALARRQERLEGLSTEIRARGRRALALPCDLQDRAALDQLPARLPADWREIDLLVNNAGLALGVEPLAKGNPDEWDRVLDTNVRALLVLTRLLLPGMLERRRGHIVNIGSVAGRQAYPGGAVYCASKAAELAISRALAMDLVGTPLRVTTIDPGLVETEFSLVRFRGDEVRARAVYQDIQPLGPRDVAEAVAWAAARPPHVQVSEMVLLPTCQASAWHVHRGPYPA
ncbi:MAG: SDR family NAD(P)-dependent oxidoreductase [bacterium]|jgi:NADP-dependent 3-hydroxy acid dehydrogenase YdfG|nr:SDR family NAD(P)-dependent oxidoreductase [bacterium]